MKYYFLFVVLMLVGCIYAMGQTTKVAPSGTGTSGDKYQITNLDNFSWLSQTSAVWNTASNSYFTQTADINATATQYWDKSDDNTDGDLYNDPNDLTSSGTNDGFSPIGNATTSFTGSYNGNGKVISGLYINNSTGVYIGLFGYVYASAATITSLGLTGINFNSTYGGTVYIGGIAGYLWGTVTNCYSTGILSKTGQGLIGGLVGFSDYGDFNKCYSKVNVTNDSPTGLTYVGGLVGSHTVNGITDCYATGSVVAGTSTYAGGLVGTNTGTITRCYSSGSVTWSGTHGGLVGNNSGTVNINSFWDTQTSGRTLSAGGTGKTTSEMKTQSTFTGASWDFVTTPVWEMIGTNYPRLKSIPDAALPVELTSFTTTIFNNSVTLNWQTATEVNNYGFEIEKKRMKDELGNMNWEKIGFVEGNGTTNSPKEYSYSEKNLTAGKYSYRLKQIDRDGKFEYSKSVEVTVSLTPKELSLSQNFPNPFNPSTMISYQLPISNHVSLKVYDAIGREVATLVNETKEAGTYSAMFDAAKLSNGIYFAKLQSGEKIQLKKMMLIK